MQTDVWEAGRQATPVPDAMKATERLAVAKTCNHVRITLEPWEFPQDLHRSFGQEHGFLAGP